ncbi:hypothetical protein [Streptomyces sp. 142MFCol3.1]|uniref:hypothetical protein n=1 Tax=Streptomyces sp. 142MFCol3.1 TaxID=1172179 RepID=UPI00048B1202|nr:hypothetical protein [Streptomyces sp. 142MFCol3.1]
MAETTTVTTELTSQYSAQVAGDLERNLKEQERIAGEIEALQAQLSALQHDHSVLVNVQQALGVPAPLAAPAPEAAAAVPAPRKKAATASGTGRKPRTAKKSVDTPRAKSSKKTGGVTPTASSSLPKLVDLVRDHLADSGEPRSAAEVATALGQQHPERAIKNTVVRTTLEGLVAKNQAQRSKQGSSVFYTTPEGSEAARETPATQQSA